MRYTPLARGRLLLPAALLLLLSACLQQAAPPRVATPPQPPLLAPQAGDGRILADFEGAAPAGFFVFNGGSSSVTTTVPTIADSDPRALPGQVGDNGVLEVAYNIGDFGGFGQDLAAGLGGPQDWSGFDGFGFWFYGSGSGLVYQAEIQDNRSDPATDTAERFDVEFRDDFLGWRFLAFPFEVFTRATDFQPGGAPNDGLGLTEMWGWAVVLPGGSDTVAFDNVQLFQLETLADFEGGPPAGYFVFNGASSVSTPTQVVAPGDPLALPGQQAANEILAATFTVNDFGGFGQDLAAALGGPQDWSGFDGVGFWFYGSGSGLGYQFEISDNRSDPATDTSERFDYTFVDDRAGWRFIAIPFSAFTRATDFQPGGAPDDGFTLTEVWAWAVVLPLGSDTVYFDNVGLMGGQVPLTVGFAAFDYRTAEGSAATITVALNTPAANEVRVDYATADGSATAGSDYQPSVGTLVFPAGTTEQSFTVTTLQDNAEEGNETVVLRLTNPVDAALGANSETTLTIVDDDFSVPGDLVVIDDFEAGLPAGQDPNGIPIGFFTFNDPSSGVAIATSAPPSEVPGSSSGNLTLRMDANVAAFAGFVHGFENAAVDTWVTQDWSAFEGFGFWLYGTGSGVTLFVDILDNRNPGSTRDDAERYSVAFQDDVAGWRFLQFPFSAFSRKEIGNGAPNDGLGLTEVHGWAFGSLASGGPRTFYLDDVGVYGTAPINPLTVSFATAETVVTEGGQATVAVRLSRPLGEAADDPTQVTVSYATEPGSAAPGRDYQPTDGTLTFRQGGPSEQTFSVPTLGNDKHDGDKTVILRLGEPSGAARGVLMQAVLVVADDDPLDPTLLDDFENGAYLWTADDGVTLETLTVTPADALRVPGQGAYEQILAATVPDSPELQIGGGLCNNGNGNGVVPVALLSSAWFDATAVDQNTVRFGDATETHRDKKTGTARRHQEDVNGDGLDDLVFHFRAAETGYDCATERPVLTGMTFAGTPFRANGSSFFGRDFAIGQDWRGFGALEFWYYGSGSGRDVTVVLKDNRAPDPGPGGWTLVWSDEFDAPAGTPPDPATWGFERGDGAVNRIPGWGNDELQYYTDSPDNVATDGLGNLVITAREADGSLACYYGPCQYTSARLISQHRAEFAYGRIEARIEVPQGSGLWPAFWSLGTDIAEVGWPQTGEIDIMEFVGRLPNEIFGTIHGPGYSGGQSFGGIYDFGGPVYTSFHTFAIEWQPDRIDWYVDGIHYHSATPSDVAPNPWVFNDPVFLLLNVAVGGNFGGPVGADTVFPQSMKVDYVRVYQAPDTAERFTATFRDEAAGWQRITVPFRDFVRSAEQPPGAPDDGLTLGEVWGYGLLVEDGSGTVYLDQVRGR